MVSTLSIPLPPELREQAEHCFEADFSRVVLHVGPQARALGSVAVAYGENVFLDPAVCAQRPDVFKHILGHELAHVLQQRSGVAVTARLRGVALNTETRHEANADAAALAFVMGKRIPSSPAPRPARGEMVAQRQVSIAGLTLGTAEELTPKTQTLLHLMEGAHRWLTWALPNPAIYAFQNEEELILGIQQGLNERGLMLLPRIGLLVYPLKLWSLKEEQLNMLLAYENQDEANPVLESGIQKILQENGLYTKRDLAVGLSFLEQLHENNNAVFQVLTLADQVALLDLVTHPPHTHALDKNLQKEAAAFALEWAQSPQEFTDYYSMYFAVSQEMPLRESRQEIGRIARNIRNELFGMVQPYLRCPQVSGVPSTVDLYAIAHRWIEAGNVIGFPSLSAALHQTVAYGRLALEHGKHPLHKHLERFMAEAQEFIKTTEPSHRLILQDGSACQYVLKSKGSQALLQVNMAGCVTLQTYQPRHEEHARAKGKE